ncbi:MAG TPA: ATP synthase F0 subunit A [Firmicutes bacterium]|nr:ATP synthase F0 subunit A [Bacillota bacterium]
MNLMLLAIQATHAVNGATGGEHTPDGDHGDGTPHLQNVVGILAHVTRQEWLNDWMNVIYSWSLMLIILLFFALAARRLKGESGEKLKRNPDRKQLFIETLMGGLDNFVRDILGNHGRTYVPLVGTLFIYILSMNLFGLVPVLGHSPSSNLNITLSLALFVFITVQIHGMRSLGIKGYVKHFADLPEKPAPIQWIFAPLMMVLHLIGELAKPVSLSLRLFGNITGEDVLVAVFVMLVAFVPLQFFIYPIALLGSTIQALVFSLLTTVYILLMSHHDEH